MAKAVAVGPLPKQNAEARRLETEKAGRMHVGQETDTPLSKKKSRQRSGPVPQIILAEVALVINLCPVDPRTPRRHELPPLIVALPGKPAALDVLGAHGVHFRPEESTRMWTLVADNFRPPR